MRVYPVLAFRDGFSSQCLVNTCVNVLEENLESLLIKNADDLVWESGK